MLCLVLVILFAGKNQAGPSPNDGIIDLDRAAEYFEKFIIDYEREYKDDEEKGIRFENFKKHLKLANERNAQSKTAVHGITMFADYTKEEFSRLTSCVNTKHMFGGSCTMSVLSGSFDAPATFDWRDRGVISPIKYQRRCGSCWAFSAIANLEAAYARKHQTILDLSEQELVDCDGAADGCFGGDLDNVGDLMAMGGAVSEADYPYKGVNQDCMLNKSKIIAQVASCKTFQPDGDLNAVKEALVTNGPLSIGVSAHEWGSYTGGVLNCLDRLINHAVLLVGYGADFVCARLPRTVEVGGQITPIQILPAFSGSDQVGPSKTHQCHLYYWIIKNSWGTEFGEQGYIRVSQMQDCGLVVNFVTSSEAV